MPLNITAEPVWYMQALSAAQKQQSATVNSDTDLLERFKTAPALF